MRMGLRQSRDWTPDHAKCAKRRFDEPGEREHAADPLNFSQLERGCVVVRPQSKLLAPTETPSKISL